MSDYLIKAENITVVKSGRTILKDITLDIKAKDFVTIIGPNGAGKSMLLKALLNIQKLTHGIVKRKNDLKIGYVPQRLWAEATLPMTVQYFLCLNKDHSQSDFKKNYRRIEY